MSLQCDALRSLIRFDSIRSSLLPRRPSSAPFLFAAGLSWSQVVAACKSLSKQLQAELLALPKLHQPLADVALAALRRAGRDKEDDEPCKVSEGTLQRQPRQNALGSSALSTHPRSLCCSTVPSHFLSQSTVERSRAHLQRLVEQEEQLSALLEALSSVQTAASSGTLQPDVNWAEYIGKLVADIEVSAQMGGAGGPGARGGGRGAGTLQGWRRIGLTLSSAALLFLCAGVSSLPS